MRARAGMTSSSVRKDLGETRTANGSRSLLRELAADERPRERLLRRGSESLSESELLAILLRTGGPGASAVDMARQILRRCGGLVGLPAASADSLRCRGVGPAKVATLLAAVEIGRRLARARLPARRPLDRPEMVAEYLSLRYQCSDQEVMGVLYVDTRQRLMGDREVYRGTLNRAAAEPRSLLKTGLLRDAAGLILFHTHPSGDPSPSPEDLAFTRRMAEAGDIVGVRLIDHLILGSAGRWVSLRQRGAW